MSDKSYYYQELLEDCKYIVMDKVTKRFVTRDLHDFEYEDQFHD